MNLTNAYFLFYLGSKKFIKKIKSKPSSLHDNDNDDTDDTIKAATTTIEISYFDLYVSLTTSKP